MATKCPESLTKYWVSNLYVKWEVKKILWNRILWRRNVRNFAKYSVSNSDVTREVKKSCEIAAAQEIQIGFDPTVNCLSDSAVVCAWDILQSRYSTGCINFVR